MLRVVRLLPELDFGGVESRLELQSRLHDRAAYELHVCGFHKDGRAAAAVRALGVPVTLLEESPSPRNPRATFELLRYLRRLRPDVVHASIAEANLHSLVAGPLARIPHLIAEETGMPSHSRLARTIYRAVYRGADRVVGVTQAVCDYVRDVDRAPPERVRLIYNCANPRYFTEPATPLSRASGPLVLLLVGRLVPVKNHAFFLRVLEDVAPRDGSIKVKLAGDGPLRAELERDVRERGLESVVELLGVRSDVRDLLQEAHVFALPSISEGCSISLIEAMASGAHVIGSDVPGIREVLGPLADGWVARVGDADGWASLLRRSFQLSASERMDLAGRAQRRAYSMFSPHTYVSTLENMYRELAG